MPISLRQIATGRLIQFWIILSAALAIYFSLMYLYIKLTGAEGLSLSTFVLYALTWYGYSLIVGVTYIYWELGTSGKVYFTLTFGYLFLYLFLTIGLLVLLKNSISISIITSIENGHWWIPVISLAVGFCSLAAGVILIERRLKKRDLTKS